MIVFEGDPSRWQAPAGGTAVAVGVFDGVHLGHRAVFDALDPAPDGTVPSVVTFDPNPAAVLGSGTTALTTLRRRLELMADAGLELAAVVTFDEELAVRSPQDFIDSFLVGALDARVVAVGEGFRFGHGASGTTDTLVEAGRRHGFEVRVVPILEIDGVPVRSSLIRRHIVTGDVARAARFLGRPHELEGSVVPGDGRGRTIGIPTANIAVDDDLAVPARGVYAVRAHVGPAVVDAVANIGTRPTFDGVEEVVEVHLLDVSQDLYGAHLRIEFVDRIRGERRFPDVEALVAQIHDDIATTRRILHSDG